MVIGGGAAGIELSGDIREDYKTKDVTLSHPREILVNDKVNESFQNTVKDQLKYLAVKTILDNEKLMINWLSLTSITYKFFKSSTNTGI